MSESVISQQPSEALVNVISAGFLQMSEESKQRDAIAQQHLESELEIQKHKNFKWKVGAYIAAIAIVALGYTLHSAITIFERDMGTMSREIVKMSGYMDSMSTDISSMNGNIGTMAPDMNTMSVHIKAIDKNMGSMKQNMGQINNAMSPLMLNMQKFMP